MKMGKHTSYVVVLTICYTDLMITRDIALSLPLIVARNNWCLYMSMTFDGDISGDIITYFWMISRSADLSNVDERMYFC